MLLVLQLNVWLWLTWSQRKSEKKSDWRDQLLEKLIEEISSCPFFTLLVISSNLYRVTKKSTQRLHVMPALHLPVDSIKWVSYECLGCCLGPIFIEMEECTIISWFCFLECVVMATATTAIIDHKDKALHLEENKKKKDLSHKVYPSQALPGYPFQFTISYISTESNWLSVPFVLVLAGAQGVLLGEFRPGLKTQHQIKALLVLGSVDSKSKETFPSLCVLTSLLLPLFLVLLYES